MTTWAALEATIQAGEVMGKPLQTAPTKLEVNRRLSVTTTVAESRHVVTSAPSWVRMEACLSLRYPVNNTFGLFSTAGSFVSVEPSSTVPLLCLTSKFFSQTLQEIFKTCPAVVRPTCWTRWPQERASAKTALRWARSRETLAGSFAAALVCFGPALMSKLFGSL